MPLATSYLVSATAAANAFLGGVSWRKFACDEQPHPSVRPVGRRELREGGKAWQPWRGVFSCRVARYKILFSLSDPHLPIATSQLPLCSVVERTSTEVLLAFI